MPDNKAMIPELLAPVGKWEVLEAVIDAGADAVYLGGKKYNMRLHLKDFNFNEAEMIECVQLAHNHEVKVYVTVNNLLTEQEVAELPDYLLNLQEIGVDALIVQDLGVIRLAREMDLSIPLHASVMVNAHNLGSLELLQELGVQRVILSRDLSLGEIKVLHQRLPIELEYFAHGDMCFSQGSQCYQSGMLFGDSGNRGRCLKPCRWPYELVDRQIGVPLPVVADGPYFLAVKDICLLPYIPEVIDAGICSLKIEGRMRPAEYLAPLVRFYRRALDRYATDPSGYTFDRDDYRKLEQMRVRDFSPLYALGNPGPAAVGYNGEREPRKFSNAVAEPVITIADLDSNPLPVLPLPDHKPLKPLLSVKVGSPAAAQSAIEQGADLVYCSGDGLLSQGGPWSKEEYRKVVATARKAGKLLITGTPRITMPQEELRLQYLMETIEELQPDGVLVTNLGALHAAHRLTSLPIYADYSLNIANHQAATLLADYRVVQTCAPLEFCFEETVAQAQNRDLLLEVVIHGLLPTMVSEHCLVVALREGKSKGQCCSGLCSNYSYGLKDSAEGIHALELDHNCRNHLYLAHELALLPYLRSCYGAGFASLRLELPIYNAAEAGAVTRLYRQQLDLLWKNPDSYHCPPELWQELLQIRKGPYGTGPCTRGIRVRESSAVASERTSAS